MDLAVGEHPWAAEARDRVRGLLAGSAEAAVLETAVLHAKGHDQAARQALRPALDGSAAPVVVSTLIEAWLLEARLAHAHGRHPRAAQALRKALALAEPCQALRPFLIAGPTLRRLLADGLPSLGPLEPFATDLLRSIHGISRTEHTSVEPLTPRENALLLRLPSLQTLDEIATDEFISVNTLKTHLRSIYRKLQVNSRREAVQAARDTGLL